MGRKCNVLECPSDSRRSEDNGVTFHKMPFHPDLRPKWIELCRIPEERQINKVIYVCSRHFRRTDFCNFKGTKYMLKQGALPSVFPWTKTIAKLPPEKSNDRTANIEIKEEPLDEDDFPASAGQLDASIKIKKESPDDIDELLNIKTEIKKEPGVEDHVAIAINFLPGTRIEANDFNDKWCPATILEVDYEENEVFVEFDKDLNRANEWIPMDSSRLRPYQPRSNPDSYSVGEKCMATWVDTANKFPATIRRIIDADTYEVLFDDGFTKTLKYHKLSKIRNAGTPLEKVAVHHASPLFDPVVGSKEDRRERKRKINVAQLFGLGGRKKQKHEDVQIKTEPVHEEEKLLEEIPVAAVSSASTVQCEGEEWTCRWLNGEPVGTEAELESAEGPRRSIIVPDHRLPEGWQKHLSRRMHGSSAGKWDTILVNPDGKKFHNRQAVKAWIEENKLDFILDQFDFCLHLHRARKLGLYEVTDPEVLAAVTNKPAPVKTPNAAKSKGTPKAAKVSTPKSTSSAVLPSTPDAPEVEPEEEDDTAGGLKIIMETDGYKCPIEGCGKNFRKENLAQMHIKHYHPEYTKFIGSTPNVADLAYARTVGEHIDDIVPKSRSTASIIEKPVKSDPVPKPKSTIKVLTPKIPAKIEEADAKKLDKSPLSPFTPSPIPKPIKDSEIIRLLNSEPKSKTIDSIFDSIPNKSSDKPSTPSNSSPAHQSTPGDKYPEIKLKDLLHKAEPIPIKKDEHRPTGIKTLLPVIRPVEEPKVDAEDDFEAHIKVHATKVPEKSRPGRKRQSSDHDVMKRRRQSYKYDTDDMSDYYEADSYSQDSFNTRKVIEQPVVPQESPEVIIEGGEVIRLVHMRSEEIINCTCGITEEDGLMIQCELCLCWQHGHCNNIERENQVPEKYICKICKNPQRMRASMKYMHDQDWLKQGQLPSGSYHTKDEELINTRSEKLRKTHELSGCLIELNEYLHNLRVKLNIAENKDHPKLYLWNKPWDKPEPEDKLNLTRPEIKDENAIDIKDDIHNSSFSSSDHSYIKSSAFGDLALKTMLEPPIKEEEIEETKNHLLADDAKIASETELISILEDDNTTVNNELKQEVSQFPKIDLNSMIANNLSEKEQGDASKDNALSSMSSGILSAGSLDLTLSQTDLDRLSSLAQLDVVESAEQAVSQQPIIPQPEAAIDPADCRMHLLDHVSHFQKLVEKRLDCIEAEVTALEEQDSNPLPDEGADNYPRMKQTLQMLIRDLSTMRQIAALSQ